MDGNNESTTVIVDYPMKILYLSCHSILEYDEVKLLTEMGHDVFSMGSYINPNAPHDNKRPPIPGKYEDHLISLATRYSKDNLHSELIEPFDVIIVQHVPDWIHSNWEKMKHKKVVWRTIGQSVANIENGLQQFRDQGLKVIRYSPREQDITWFIGGDALIRFYKDPEEFKDWNGDSNRVITLGQSIKKRGIFCQFNVFDEVTKDLERVVFGADNDDLGSLWGGQLDYDTLKAELRNNRVFVYTGTQPASYTLGFIEAMMTGIPIVAVGSKLGNSLFGGEQDTYEIPDFIENGVNGFVSDSIPELREAVVRLLEDHELAKKISAAGRETAIKLFGREHIKNQWKDFLESI